MNLKLFRYFVQIIPAVALLSACGGEVRAADSEEVANGLQLAERLCARCHAVERTGDSPFQPAPPFRELVKRWDDTQVLSEALAEGINVGHPAMPEFVLETGEIANLLRYMETLRE